MRKALDFYEQIELLKSRGLHFTSEEKAIEILSNINYYNIINAYKELFLDKNVEEEKFKEKVTFEEICSVYIFDCKLRTLFLHFFLIAENKIRTKLSHNISIRYNCEAYLDETIYDANVVKIDQIKEFVHNITEKNINKNIVQHFENINENIPIWAFLDCFQFGDLRTFYFNLNQSIKDIVAKEFSLTSKQFKSILSLINFFRNVAAHGNRFYNFRINDGYKQISDLNLHQRLDIQRFNKKYKYGKKDLFAVLIALKYLLSSNEYEILINHISEFIEEMHSNIFSISIKDILIDMGFIPRDSNDNEIDWKIILNL